MTVTMEDGSTVTGSELLVAVGPEAEHGQPRARDDRPRAGQAGRGRLESPFVATRLAVRDRRRERPRPAHAHGQVPGAARGRLDPREERDAGLRRPALAARDLHRPAGRRRGPHAGIGRGGRDGGARGRCRDGLDRGCELRRPRRARNLQARHRRRASRHRGRHLHRRRGRRVAARGDDRRRLRSPTRPAHPRRPLLPDAERDLAEAPRGSRCSSWPRRSTTS